MPEDIYQLVYISVESYRFRQSDLTDLLTTSRKWNSENGITGLLLYAEGQFMQLLEGSKADVQSLVTQIKADARHHHVSVLEEGPVSCRRFSEWSMAFLDFASPQVRGLPGYSAFLESPLTVGDAGDLATRNLRLLQYFKAITTASDSSVLNLVATIERHGEDTA